MKLVRSEDLILSIRLTVTVALHHLIFNCGCITFTLLRHFFLFSQPHSAAPKASIAVSSRRRGQPLTVGYQKSSYNSEQQHQT